MKVELICDESGAKGKANNVETVVGEVGLVAGILVEDHRRAGLQAELEQVCSPHRVPGAKLHITDLVPGQQSDLRERIFACLRDRNVICLYNAIHVQGFNDAFGRQVEMVERAKADRRSPVKVSGNTAVPSLHEELFGGLFAKAVAVVEGNGLLQGELVIRTDRIDRGVAKAFRNTIEEFKLVEHRVFDVSGWDPRTRQVVNGQVQFDATIPPDMEVKFLKAGTVSLQADNGDDSLIVAADVLANSLNYHFAQRSDCQQGAPLNRREALNGHPLHGLFASLWNDPHIEWCDDAVYQHPIERARLAAADLLPLAKTSEAKKQQLTELVRERAYEISVGPGRNFAPEKDWDQARRQLLIPHDLYL